jgi:hypothetical protein
MKKTFFFLALTATILISSCGSNTEQKQNDDSKTAADSVKEQKNLDSLFNAASKNVEGAKDTLKK